MVIIRNEKHIANRRRIGLTTSLAGIAILIGGMIVSLISDPTTYGLLPLLALPLGFLLSQVGLYFSHRYVRAPRPDERIDEGLRKAAKGSRLYHYVLPIPHVLLSPGGVIAIVSKYQSGNIVADGYKWTQKGLGLRRFFGQENVGNPSNEAEYQIKQLAKYISRNVPELAEKEIPMSAIIVFTTKEGGELDLRNSTIPAMHYTKLKGFWKQRKNDVRLPESDFKALQAAFDAAAGEDAVVETT